MRALLLVFLVASCASAPRDDGFDDVTALVHERTAQRVVWNRDGTADREVEASVDALLRRDLDVESAVQVAWLENPDLQASFEALGIAQADLVEAGLLHNPVFDGSVRFAEGGAGSTIDLGVSQDFLSVLYLPLRKRVAEAAFEATKLRVAGEVLDLAGRVRTDFYELQGAEQLAEMRADVALATEASFDLARRIHDAGNVRDLDVVNEQMLHEEARVDLAAAQLEAIEARERLNELLGLWGERSNWKLAARLPTVPDEPIATDDLESQAVERSLDLRIAALDIRRAAARLGFGRTGAVLQDSEIGIVSERDPDGTWSVGPSVRIPLPIFSQGQSAMARAEAELHRAQAEYRSTAIAIRTEVRAVASRLVALSQRARHYESVLLPLHSRSVDETQLLYNAMQTSPFQLLLAKRQQIEAGARYVETLRDFWLARTELDQLLRGRRTDSMSSSKSRSRTMSDRGANDPARRGH